MHSESLITRGRNKMVLRFLEDESLTHLFWIDSDIGFTPQAVCRLLLADRDVAAGVYPMKSMHWPKEGLPVGHDARAIRGPLRRIPVQRNGKNEPIRRRRRLRRSGRGADRVHVSLNATYSTK